MPTLNRFDWLRDQNPLSKNIFFKVVASRLTNKAIPRQENGDDMLMIFYPFGAAIKEDVDRRLGSDCWEATTQERQL